VDKSYQDGMRLAADETGLSINIFSQTCPFIFDDILDIDYLPNHD
jgi:hypothetical protein